MLSVKTVYKPDSATLENDRGSLRLGRNQGEFYPYDLLLGALSACFYSTLHDILEKKKMTMPSVEIVVSGEKRKEVPTTLRWVKLDISVLGDVDEAHFRRSVDLAAKYCSIHETISKVAQMDHEVHFLPVQG